MKVTVKPYDQIEYKDGRPSFVSDMKKYCGKQIKIKLENNLLRGMDWTWHKDWLIFPKVKSKVKSKVWWKEDQHVY